MRPRTALLAVLTLGLVVGSVAPAFASPQPKPVCGACGHSIVDAAEEHGVALNVTESTARVELHENRTATWTVTNTVNASAAERLREAPALRDRIAGAAARDGYGLPFADDGSVVTVESSSVDGQTVTVRFTHSLAAERHAGLLVYDGLHTEGVRGGWILNADEFTVVGPPGTRVVNDPASVVEENPPRVEGRSVTWEGSVGDPYDYEGIFREDVYLVFGSDPAPGQVSAAVALATAPLAISNLRAFVLPPTLLFAVGVAAYGLSGWRPAFDTGTAAALLVGGGLLALAHPLYGEVLGVHGDNAMLFGIGSGLLCTGLAAREETAPVGSPLRRGLLAVGLTYALTALLVYPPGATEYRTAGEAAAFALRESAAVLPFVALYPFGLVTASTDRRARLLRSLALVALFALSLGVRVPLTGRVWGVALILYVAITVGGLLCGVPLFALGRAVAGRERGGADSGAEGRATAAD